MLNNSFAAVTEQAMMEFELVLGLGLGELVLEINPSFVVPHFVFPGFDREPCVWWLQDEIVGSEREQYLLLYQLYLPVFMQLVNILLIKVRMPPDDEYSSWNDGKCDT